jgi:hypothetical protein
MSRSGYYDDIEDPLAYGRWRAQVKSSTRGKRGQKLLKDMLAALDAMPEKRLVSGVLEISSEADERNAQKWVDLFKDPDAANRYRKHYVETRPPSYKEGDVCALGAIGRVRGLDMSGLDPEDPEGVAVAFDVAEPLAREIVFMNDEGTCSAETPEERWKRMREWVSSQIIDDKSV